MSLLPLAGMFIFGRKKEEDPMEIYRRLARKYGLTVEQVKKIGRLIVRMGKNLPELVANADPEQDVRRMYKILDIERLPSKEGKKYVYIKSIQGHAHHKRGIRAKHKDAIKIHIVHPFLALTMSHLAKSTSKHVGHAVGDALDGLVVEGHEFEKLRSNPETLAELIIQFAKDRGIPVKEEDKDKLVIAFQKAAKIADKLVADASEERLDALYQALAEETEDPLYILKRNGVDIEPELEEFRQFLAEISGKKIETRKAVDEMNASGNIALEAQKLLGILNGLKFADYSERAVEKALKELDTQIEKLIEARNLELLGLYSTVALFLRNGRFEKAEEFLKKLSG